MPRFRFKPEASHRGNHSNRVRTSSQSSVEIQVTEHDLSILSTVPPHHRIHTRSTPGSNMVLPTTEFLRLIKTVGAVGQDSAYGELFTFKQLCFYLKEYIKVKQLYDPSDPLVIHCANDPIGQVFGVQKFTFQETLSLVQRNTLVLDSLFTKRRNATNTHQMEPHAMDETGEDEADVSASERDCNTPISRNGMDLVTSTTVTVATPRTPPKHSATYLSETENEEDLSHRSQYDASSAVKHLFLDENANKESVRNVSNTRCGHSTVEHESEGKSSPLVRISGYDLSSCSRAVHGACSDTAEDKQVRDQRLCCRSKQIEVKGRIQCTSSCENIETNVQRHCRSSHAETEVKVHKQCSAQMEAKGHELCSSHEEQIQVKGQVECSTSHHQTVVRGQRSFGARFEQTEGKGHEHCSSKPTEVQGERQSISCLVSSSDKEVDRPSSPVPGQSRNTDAIPGQSRSSDTVPGHLSDPEVAGPSCKPRRRRKRTKSDRVSESRHSFSIYYQSGDEDGSMSQDWCLQVELGDSDDRETVYSVQSKETVYVKDSSDDMWFLDDEDEISFEIRSTHSGHFQEEYEVESEVNSNHGDQDYQSDGSESPVEEIVVLCDDSDTQFWADSEYSDSERDSTDEDLSPDDKWSCAVCDTQNGPLSRHCNRCWKIRPDWVTENKHATNHTQGHRLTNQKNSSTGGQHRMRAGVSNQTRMEGFSGRMASSTVVPPGAGDRHYSKNIVMDRFLNSQPEAPRSDSAKPVLDSPRHKYTGGSVTSGSSETATVTMPNTNTDETSCKPSLARSDTLPVTELFKVPSSVQVSREESKCSAKGRLLPRLQLPMDDSGISSLPSSQESSYSYSSHETALNSPVKKTKSMLSPSPENYMTVSPRKRPISPYKHQSPRLVSPFSNKQNIFAFDPTLSPAKRLYQPMSQASSHISLMPSAASSVPASPKRPESSRKIFFVDPLPSPKKRAANGVEYSNVCMICLSKPKEASIIHGKTGHQVCCYLCAKQLRRRGRPCPVCRRPIQKVIKNYLV